MSENDRMTEIISSPLNQITMGMFCYQCQEAAGGIGCTIKGVCGKQPETSALMDVLLFAVRGEAIVNTMLRQQQEQDDQASKQMMRFMQLQMECIWLAPQKFQL
jgi:hydroxylamine reductase (hybrid-cluster protein)